MEDFELATAYAKVIISKLKSNQVLELYGLYKQATVGDNNTDKPVWYNLTDKQKWEAWNSQKGKSSECAKKDYVAVVESADENWRENVAGADLSKENSWVHHSSLIDTDAPLTEDEKTIFDWVKENNIKKIECLVQKKASLNIQDENGLTPLHWAADRGHLEILELLLSWKAEVNALDHEGQTPLHYASLCDHVDSVRLLLKFGADFNLEDNDGLSPKDSTTSQDILDLFV